MALQEDRTHTGPEVVLPHMADTQLVRQVPGIAQAGGHAHHAHCRPCSVWEEIKLVLETITSNTGLVCQDLETPYHFSGVVTITQAPAIALASGFTLTVSSTSIVSSFSPSHPLPHHGFHESNVHNLSLRSLLEHLKHGQLCNDGFARPVDAPS